MVSSPSRPPTGMGHSTADPISISIRRASLRSNPRSPREAKGQPWPLGRSLLQSELVPTPLKSILMPQMAQSISLLSEIGV